MIGHITSELYADSPAETLYHYSNYKGLMGIIADKAIWATDIRYMNDSAELRHTADLIALEIGRRLQATESSPQLLNLFLDWVKHRITNGHMLFAASFRSHGNLLSQWRGYSSHGKGVSVGFASKTILSAATRQNFQVGRCIYNSNRQRELIAEVVDAVEVRGKKSLSLSPAKEFQEEIYHRIFSEIEGDLLRIAAILKHPSFREEEEWRVVSAAITDYRKAGVHFREGASMLVPYIPFKLADSKNAVALEHVFLGPTSNSTISLNSLEMFLDTKGSPPAKGVNYCQIPYRRR